MAWLGTHVQHGLLDVLARVHEVADDADGLVVDAHVVGTQHLNQRWQRLRQGIRDGVWCSKARTVSASGAQASMPKSLTLSRRTCATCAPD